MACIKSAQRGVLVAIAPESPYLVAGTMAGAVSLSCSSTAILEVFNLDFQSDAPDMPLVASIPSSYRFNRLSWSKPLLSDEFSLGLVAGGLCDGSIGLWNPQTMISSRDQDAALVRRLEKHVGPVRGLEFCTLSPNLLASGADEGELCIWDLAKPFESNLFPSYKVYKQSVGSGAQTEISFVSWNFETQHLLASTSYNGITLIWDLRHQQPVISFSDSKMRCSVLQWSPEFSDQLVVATDDDNSPSLRVWDVRKTISPLREFVGHTKGVVAMSWCPYDSSYLLTSAKDNRTICWDTKSGEIACELPPSTKWNVDVHWCPMIRGFISASSCDGKIEIYNIQPNFTPQQIEAQPSVRSITPSNSLPPQHGSHPPMKSSSLPNPQERPQPSTKTSASLNARENLEQYKQPISRYSRENSASSTSSIPVHEAPMRRIPSRPRSTEPPPRDWELYSRTPNVTPQHGAIFSVGNFVPSSTHAPQFGSQPPLSPSSLLTPQERSQRSMKTAASLTAPFFEYPEQYKQSNTHLSRQHSTSSTSSIPAHEAPMRKTPSRPRSSDHINDWEHYLGMSNYTPQQIGSQPFSQNFGPPSFIASQHDESRSPMQPSSLLTPEEHARTLTKSSVQLNALVLENMGQYKKQTNSRLSWSESLPEITAHEAPATGMRRPKSERDFSTEPSPKDWGLHPGMTSSTSSISAQEGPMLRGIPSRKAAPRSTNPPLKDWEIYPGMEPSDATYLPRVPPSIPAHVPTTMTGGIASHQYTHAKSNPPSQVQDQHFASPNLSRTQQSSPTMAPLQQQTMPDVVSIAPRTSMKVDTDSKTPRGAAVKSKGRFFGFF